METNWKHFQCVHRTLRTKAKLWAGIEKIAMYKFIIKTVFGFWSGWLCIWILLEHMEIWLYLWIATVSWWFFQSYIFVAFIVHFARLFLMRIPMFPHSSFEAETWKKWQSQFFRMSMSLSVLHLCSWIATLSRLICLQPFISW